MYPAPPEGRIPRFRDARGAEGRLSLPKVLVRSDHFSLPTVREGRNPPSLPLTMFEGSGHEVRFRVALAADQDSVFQAW
eukprot:1928640-Rhodomonas_salina.9